MLRLVYWCLNDEHVEKMGPRMQNEGRWIFKIVRFTSIKRTILLFIVFTAYEVELCVLLAKEVPKSLWGGLREVWDRARIGPRAVQRAGYKN